MMVMLIYDCDDGPTSETRKILILFTGSIESRIAGLDDTKHLLLNKKRTSVYQFHLHIGDGDL